MTRALVWLQNDLRIEDNTALYHASHYADSGIAAVYFIAENMWRQHDIAACKVDFILRNLQSLSDKLRKYNVPLLVRYVTTFVEVPEILSNIVCELNIDALFFNKQYEADELSCQNKVEQKLRLLGSKVFSYDDQTILPPHKVLTQQNTPYTIFTPFKKAWLREFMREGICIFPAIKKASKQIAESELVPSALSSFISIVDCARWPEGESSARQRLETFIHNHLYCYHKERDFPALSGTSQLSPYLALGVISPRQCLQEVLEIAKKMVLELPEGAQGWVNGLIWREFYKQILFHFPRISMERPFKLITEKIIWGNDLQLFEVWQQGRTGYPLIDAGMRQLKQIGWMHNRLRMVVAMFLVKNLFIDWRWGEKFFMQHLIDGDLAANNGGWQWAASTGTDAAPYFRIFNPILQSKKFDPEGRFIKEFCPELRNFSSAEIHEPYILNPLLAQSVGYPAPIIKQAEKKEQLFKAFSLLKASKKQ